MNSSRFVRYFSTWSDAKGHLHYSVDVWDDVRKWNWGVHRDYVFQKCDKIQNIPKHVVVKDGNEYVVIRSSDKCELTRFFDKKTAEEFCVWKNNSPQSTFEDTPRIMIKW